MCSSRNVNDGVVNLLPGEQGVSLVASLAYGKGIYANRRMIEEIRYADG